MFELALTFLLVALLAGALGFGAFVGSVFVAAIVVFVVALLAFLVWLWLAIRGACLERCEAGRRGRSQPPAAEGPSMGGEALAKGTGKRNLGDAAASSRGAIPVLWIGPREFAAATLHGI